MSKTPAESIGIDIGGTFIKAGRFSSDGKRLSSTKIATPLDENPNRAVDEIAHLIQSLAPSDSKFSFDRVGVGIPGVIDRASGKLLVAPNLPKWNGFALRGQLENILGCRVLLENDANCAALGEHWMGASKGQGSFLMTTLGTGVGGGLILDNRLWIGTGGMAGEFGHICVDPAGPKCPCGAKGCLEAFSSATAILRTAKDRGLKVDNVKAVFDLAKSRDLVAQGILDSAGAALGRAIGTVAQLLDVRHFVIGGGVGQSLAQLMPSIQAEIQPRIYGREFKDLKIVESQLGDEAGVYGAATLGNNFSALS